MVALSATQNAGDPQLVGPFYIIGIVVEKTASAAENLLSAGRADKYALPAYIPKSCDK